MKFQNFVTDAQTDGQTEEICPFNFSKVGGINRYLSLIPLTSINTYAP